MQDNYRTLKVGLIRTDTEDRKIDRKSLVNSYLEKEDLDVLVGPEYSFFLEKPATKDEFEKALKELAEKSRGKKTLLLPGTFLWQDERNNMYNTLPVVQDGKLVFSYDKKHDGGDGGIAKKFNMRYATGNGKGVFEWQGMRIGVEICADHGDLREGGEKQLDLQILVSAGMSLFDYSIVLKDYGYALRCDGSSPSVEVRQKKADKIEKLEPSKVQDHTLFIYELRLPAAPDVRQERYFWNSIF